MHHISHNTNKGAGIVPVFASSHPLCPEVSDPTLEVGRLPGGDGEVPDKAGPLLFVSGDEEILLHEVRVHPEVGTHRETDDDAGRRTSSAKVGESCTLIERELH